MFRKYDRFSGRRAGLALLAATTFAAVAPPVSAGTLTVRDGRLYLPAEVNGPQVEALLDSGAELPIADVRFAEKAGISGGQAETARGTGAGTVEARIAENVRISALGHEFPRATIAVIDLADVAARLTGGKLDFVLGREIFDAGRWLVDVSDGDMRLAGADQPTGVRLPLTTMKGLETIPVEVGGIPASADFDLGNGSDLRVSARLVKALGLEPVGMEPAGGISGAALTPVVIVPELNIANRTFRDVRAHVSPNDEQGPDLNVGLKLLRCFRMTVDFPGRAIWFQDREQDAGAE